MEPNTSPMPGGPESAPAPQTSQESTSVQPENAPMQSPEAAPAPQEVERPAGESVNQNPGMSLPPTPQGRPTQQQAVPPQDDSQSDDQRLAGVNAPDIANDVDVIEKEWVDKAKEIVKGAVDDPHKQNHDVSLLKADYMRKRYGKEIKLPEDN